MAKCSKRENPNILIKELVKLLKNFEQKLLDEDLRTQVTSLIPANYALRNLGSSLIMDDEASSARDRILSYIRKYPTVLVHSDELMVVAGISEFARRIRELRIEMGWPIISGQTLKVILEDGESFAHLNIKDAKPDTYILLEDKQDRDSAHRWKIANDLRKSKLSVKDKIIAYLRENIGKNVTGEELQYLAGNKSEWARRVRELRTEDGWPVATRSTGMPSLPIGVYILEEDRQAEVHDRKIPDPVRVKVLERDSYSCKKCGWNHENKNKADKYRNFLELHHIDHHVNGGKNTVSNLISLCNVCHDDVHRNNIEQLELHELISSNAILK